MVETRLNLEPEVQKALACIDNKQNFLISGGAGSGKTYSLVQIIRQVILENPTAKVACMTYTNAAVKEIEHRVNHRNLNVSTIHDFLWDNIKHFQKELKASIIALANNPDVSKIKLGEDIVPNDFFDSLEKGIQYKEFLKLQEGIISHDELLVIASFLFETYPKLSDIVKDKYGYIFIDEYQDTNKLVVAIFLNQFKQSSKFCVVGFLGDAMQAIYDDGVGNLDEYKDGEAPCVVEIKKEQNRRSPQKVISLANMLRTDGLEQVPSDDVKAPNMQDGNVKEGKVFFMYSTNSDIDAVKEHLVKEYNWKFSDYRNTKELNLTHNLIAEKAGFKTLMEIYDKDQVLNYRDRIKSYIKNNQIDIEYSKYTFGEVIRILENDKNEKELKPIKPTNTMQGFIEINQELYDSALNYNCEALFKIYVNKDQLIDDKKQDSGDENKKGSKRDNLIKHLFKIQHCISLYQTERHNEFLRITDYRHKLTSIKAKKYLREHINSLVDVSENTIEEIIYKAHESGICLVDDKLDIFKTDKEYLYNRVKSVPFKEFQNLYDYLEGKTPFSTQHKTKGAEYDNVLVVLDNGNWNNYNFEKMFLHEGTPSVLERSKKIFYVCCTRAKENLAVYYHAPSEEVLKKAEEWFGKSNIIPLN